jgi:hypothetical protein
VVQADVLARAVAVLQGGHQGLKAKAFDAFLEAGS